MPYYYYQPVNKQVMLKEAFQSVLDYFKALVAKHWRLESILHKQCEEPVTWILAYVRLRHIMDNLGL